MTKDQCLEQSRHWLAIAERGYAVDAKQLGIAANMYARPAVAAAIAQTYATMALSVERESAENLVG